MIVTKTPELSVFFPAYNEETNIESTVLKTIKVLNKIAAKWEIIIVDDGSKDKTGEISDQLAKNTQGIRVVHHKPNRGYGGALKTGFNEAKFKWVVFTDSDGQFDFAEISKFLDKIDSFDLILGYRINRADSLMRKIYTFGWSLIPKVLWNLSVKDYSCGFKLIKKEVYESILPLVGEEKITQIEMLVKAKKKGYKITEVGVRHYPRTSGQQTGASLKVVVRSLLDLLKLWVKLR